MQEKWRPLLAWMARLLAVSATLPAMVRLLTALGGYRERPVPGEAMLPSQLAILLATGAVYFLLACGWRHPMFLLASPLAVLQVRAAMVAPQPWIPAISGGSVAVAAAVAAFSTAGRRALAALSLSLALAFCAYLVLAVASPYVVQCGREAAWMSDLKGAGALLGAGILFCLSFEFGVNRLRGGSGS